MAENMEHVPSLARNSSFSSSSSSQTIRKSQRSAPSDINLAAEQLPGKGGHCSAFSAGLGAQQANDKADQVPGARVLPRSGARRCLCCSRPLLPACRSGCVLTRLHSTHRKVQCEMHRTGVGGLRSSSNTGLATEPWLSYVLGQVKQSFA